ncbi:MAG TPA: hypothetical protein VGJ87_13230 [Roseiflexaceae bacterium]|jgi:hypothetical protein
MTAKRYFFWGSVLAFLAGGLVRWLRPAILLSAKVTAVTPGDPPIASVALAYGAGLAPASVIVDLRDRDGSGGSATVEGQQMLLEVPLLGATDADYRIMTTVTYRVLGRPRTVVREFPAGVSIV